MTSSLPTASAPGPSLTTEHGSLQLLGLCIDGAGEEVYEIASRGPSDAEGRRGELRHAGGTSWALRHVGDDTSTTLTLGTPDEVFAAALGPDAPGSSTVSRPSPYWPDALCRSLARRHVSGAGRVAFDGPWFLEQLTTSAMDRPLLFPDAARRLGLEGLLDASEMLSGVAGRGEGHDDDLVQLLLQALAAESQSGAEPPWGGEGRLIGESTWEDLAQVGEDIAQGCQAALGTGPLRVVFDPDEPMGLGFGPRVPSAEVLAGEELTEDGSSGTGADVGEVEPGGAAEEAGVRSGMVLTHLSGPELVVGKLPFEDVLEALDDRRASGAQLAIIFDTAAPLTHLYAVEMPAASALSAIAGSTGGSPDAWADDAGVGASFDALCGDALLWREPTPRLFLGASGSVTCAHTDICPQLQLAHGLLGTKVLGVASHEATGRLLADHAGEEGGIDEGATHVPTNRPLSPRQANLLGDPDMTLVLLRAGDLAVFDSGALHFASNGADGCSGALFHGTITAAALPRLRRAAEQGPRRPTEEGYGDHLFAEDLLRLVDAPLASS